MLANRILNVGRWLKHGSRPALRKFEEYTLSQLLRTVLRGKVVSGPFRGMRLTKDIVFGAGNAKLLGVYELELHETVEALSEVGSGCILNVGAGEGYYAIGMAIRCPQSQVLAFERLDVARPFIEANARLNAVWPRLDLHGECTESSLYNMIDRLQVTMVLMDVEGSETDLLSDRVVAALHLSYVLVECHEFAEPGCVTQLASRFEATHNVRIVDARPRCPANFPLSLPLPGRLKILLMDEHRPSGMQWIIAFPQARQ